jgi:hypothetical protein
LETKKGKVMSEQVKRIVVLANSRKVSGRCIAGKEVSSNGFIDWVRPVSLRPAGELSEADRQFSDGTDPKLLDVVDIYMTKHAPHGFQTENYAIDDTKYWRLVRKCTPADLKSALDASAVILWDNSAPSTAHGLHDRVEDAVAANLKGSLLLIEVPMLTITVAVEGAGFPSAKRRLRGSFSYKNVSYILSITDPVVERDYLKMDDGRYPVGPVTLCISLGDSWQGYAYKLIAGVIFT